MNVYGRAREDRLSQMVETVAKNLLPDENCVPSVYRKAVGAETESATPFINRELRLVENGGGGGIRTRVRK